LLRISLSYNDCWSIFTVEEEPKQETSRTALQADSTPSSGWNILPYKIPEEAAAKLALSILVSCLISPQFSSNI
jgi:hypothetical protein